MTVTPAELTALSRLLDEAMDLPVGEREAWLAALPAADQPLAPMLREMLAEQSGQSGASHPDFLNALPKLGDGAASGEEFAAAGGHVGPYRLIREIGRGGMGVVWLAERADGSLKREVALKLPRLAWGAGLAERMKRERDIGALLAHPNIARLYDAGVDAQGRPYLALEYIDGQPLDAWCEAQSLSIPQRLRLFLQVVRAVAYAHGRLVVHRDLKPSNVLVTADGQAHLLDFGIAKLLHEAAPGDAGLTQEQGRVLTPHHASPEQLKGETITVASDVYSLGVLLYGLLTKRHPHQPERKSLAALEEAILTGEPALASSRAQDKRTSKALRGELDAILAKALKREPDQRYATADALAEDIERHLAGETVLAQPDSLGYRWAKAVRRHRVGVAAAGAVLFALIGGATMAMIQAERASEAAERARAVKEFIVDVFKVNERGNPANNELRQLPAEILLERGAKLIETKFAGQPQLQAELYGVVSGVFADVGATQLAVDYATRQVDALVAIGASRTEQAKSLLILTRALLSQRRYSDGELRARQALALATADKGARIEAWVALARALSDQGKDDAALFELKALEDEARLDAGPPTLVRAEAKRIRAYLLSDGGEFDRAFTTLVSAIADAEAVEGPLSNVAISMRSDVVRGSLELRRFKEAREIGTTLLESLRARGGAGDIRAALIESDMTKTLFSMRQISFQDAVTTIERCRSAVSASGLQLPRTAVARIERDLGWVHLLWGWVERAQPLIARSGAVLRTESDGPMELFLQANIDTIVAFASGKHTEADRAARDVVEARVRMGGGVSPLAADDYVLVAVNLSAQQRFAEAEAFLANAPKIQAINSTGTPAMVYVEAIEAARARILIDKGDAQAALPIVQKIARDEFSGVLFDKDALDGEARCALGQFAAGLKELEEVTSMYSKLHFEHDPSVARIRSVTGLCALAAGQRKRAAEHAALASLAFAAQPGVSPYFKAPLAKLNDRLRAR